MTAANAVCPDWEQLLLWGFSVFPLLPRDKKAAVPWATYQKERAAGKLVKQWADDRRGLNAAVVTGAVSGVIVLDTDSTDAEAEVQRRGVPRTPTVKTAKGRHRYFKHPGFAVRNFAGRIAGVDLRGDGGYVVAAGSIHSSGFVYAWEVTPDEADFASVPDWLLDLIRAPTPTVAARGWAKRRRRVGPWVFFAKTGRMNCTVGKQPYVPTTGPRWATWKTCGCSPASPTTNLLMTFDADGTGRVTPLYEELLAAAKNFGAQVLVIDTAADVFGGNENIRNQVRQFIAALTRIAMEIDGAVILCAHPSIDGMSKGHGFAGSTAWNNSVRSRLYLTRPAEDEAGAVDP